MVDETTTTTVAPTFSTEVAPLPSGEVRVTLLSEWPDSGETTVEDEVVVGSDESISRLTLSTATKSALQDAQAALDRAGEQSDGPVFAVGQTVEDENPPEWGGDRMRVIDPDAGTADSYDISDFGAATKTVARANPDYPSDDRVVEVEYIDGSNQTYAFPESRLRLVED